MQVVVMVSPAPREVLERTVQLAEGATVADAVRASGLAGELPALVVGESDVGVWGRRVGWAQALREGDRVELYRPLTVDPKVARRERFRKQGARAAGLFAQRRPGGKPGY